MFIEVWDEKKKKNFFKKNICNSTFPILVMKL